MSFTQKKKKNILYCNGCRKHCSLNVHYDINESIYFPMINNVIIHNFTDENDTWRYTHATLDYLEQQGYDTDEKKRAHMLERAHRISRLCDKYKQR